VTAGAQAEQVVARRLAAEIGDAYLSAGNQREAPLASTAYAQLQLETDRLFQAAVQRDDPRATRIVFTRCPEPYRSDVELIAAVRATRVLEVPTAAIDASRIHPLLGCEFGGPFDRFRAVHDLIGHVRTGFGFGLADELAAWRVQHRRHGRLARRALATEILGVNSARAILRETPEHKPVLLDRALVTRSLKVLASTDHIPRVWSPV
jgi:hypothetical protein